MMKLVLWESVLTKTMMMKFNTIAKYTRTFRISRMQQNGRQIPNVANARILLNASLVAHNPNLTQFYLLKNLMRFLTAPSDCQFFIMNKKLA